MRADIADLPVRLPCHAHSSVMGAALLAGVASGAFKHIREAATLISASADYLPPDLCAGAKLDQSYQRYRRLFSSLKSIFPQP